MAAKAVMAVRRFMVSPFAHHQFSSVAQDAKQAVSTDLHWRANFDAHQVMQLTRAYPGLAATLFKNKVHDLLILTNPRVKSSITLVIRLARNAHEHASPGDAQALDLPLREDLPGRFFTTETP